MDSYVPGVPIFPLFPARRRSRRRRVVTGACAGLLALCALAPAPDSARAVDPSTQPARIVSVPGQPVLGRLFAPNSVWNQPLAANAPLDPASGRLVAHFASEAEAELRAGTGPFVETYSYTTPIYVVGPFQRTVRVTIDTDQNSTLGSFAAGRFGRGADPGQCPAIGGHRQADHDLPAFLGSSVGVLALRRESDGWHARWGGAIDNVSSSPGYYSPLSWNGALSVWGATATSLPLVAGTMTLAELRSATSITLSLSRSRIRARGS